MNKYLAFLLAFLNALYAKVAKLFTNRRAVSGMVLALVVALVTIAVLIPIGLLVTTNIESSLPALTAGSAAANATSDVFTNVYTAFSLSALVPIVAVAGLLIAIIVGAFAFRGMRR